MSRRLARAAAFALLLVGVAAGAAPSTDPVPASTPAVPRVVAGVYRGTFGSNTIEMTLTEDKDSEDSVHGWYVLLDSAHPERVQLAGEWEDDTLTMEESRNGIDVSGSWSAIFSDDGFSGQWSDINGEHATDVVLHRVPTTTKKKS